MQGYLKKYHTERAFGFITSNTDGVVTDWFFHRSDFPGDPARLSQFARVTFDTQKYRIRGTQEERIKAVNIRVIEPDAPKPHPQIPYEPTPTAAPPSAPKQSRIAGQAKTILSTDDAPRPASAPASSHHTVTAAAALADADGQLKFGLTAPKNDGGAQ